MSNGMQLSGLAEADGILSQLPILLRGQYLEKSLLDAMAVINRASAERAPASGKSVGGIPYTEQRRGFRASRKRLAKSIGSVLRRYVGDDVIAVVGGPRKKDAGRISHLVEFGFHHTTGGTFAGSGGRTRRAQKQIGIKLTRLKARGGPLSAANSSDSTRFISTRRISKQRKRRLENKYFVSREYATDEGKTGAGKRGAVIPGRSFVGAAFEAHKSQVQQLVIEALKKFADELTRKKNKA